MQGANGLTTLQARVRDLGLFVCLFPRHGDERANGVVIPCDPVKYASVKAREDSSPDLSFSAIFSRGVPTLGWLCSDSVSVIGVRYRTTRSRNYL